MRRYFLQVDSPSPRPSPEGEGKVDRMIWGGYGYGMNYLSYLHPLTPVLSAVLVAIIADILLRLVPQLRDRVGPVLGLPGRLAQSLLRKLNRPGRAQKVRLSRGIITLLIIIIVGFGLGALAQVIAGRHPKFEPVIWFLCLQLTFPWSAGGEILKALQQKNQQGVAAGLAVLERRQVPVLVPSLQPDRHAVVRMLIEGTATSLHRGLLSPLLWAAAAKLLGGPPLLVAVFVACLLEGERIVVTQETKESAFAFGFEVVEAIINFVPARVAALLWVLGALFTPGANPLRALRGMFTQSQAHRAINSGWPVAAVANALNIALPGGKQRDGWIGPKNATAKADSGDVQRALWLHAVTVALTILVLAALLLLSVGV